MLQIDPLKESYEYKAVQEAKEKEIFRGYSVRMSRKDIQSNLDLIEETSRKYYHLGYSLKAYLINLDSKIELMDSQTKKNFYAVLGKYHLSTPMYSFLSLKYFKKAGFEKSKHSNDLVLLAIAYGNRNEYSKETKFMDMSQDVIYNEDLRIIGKQSINKSYLERAKDSEKSGWFHFAAKYYGYVGDKKNQEIMYVKSIKERLNKSDFYSAQDDYEALQTLNPENEELVGLERKIKRFYKRPSNQKESVENIRELKRIPKKKGEPKVLIKLDLNGRGNFGKCVYMEDKEENRKYFIALPARKAKHASIVYHSRTLFKKNLKVIGGAYIWLNDDKLILAGGSETYGRFPEEKKEEVVDILKKKFPEIEVEAR